MSKQLGSEPLENQKHEKFCQLLATKNISQAEAYKQAGFSAKGDRSNSSRLMAEDSVFQRLEYLRFEQYKLWGDKREKLLYHLERVIFSSITDYLEQNSDGSIVPKNLDELKPQQRIALKTFSKNKNGCQIALHDKLRAIEIFANLTGMNSDFAKCKAWLERQGYNLDVDAEGNLSLTEHEECAA